MFLGFNFLVGNIKGLGMIFKFLMRWLVGGGVINWDREFGTRGSLEVGKFESYFKCVEFEVFMGYFSGNV